MIARRRLSARSSRASRHRPQPMLSRMANSRCRATALATSIRDVHARHDREQEHEDDDQRCEQDDHAHHLIAAAEHQAQRVERKGLHPAEVAILDWIRRLKACGPRGDARAKLLHALSWTKHAKELRIPRAALGAGRPCGGTGGRYSDGAIPSPQIDRNPRGRTPMTVYGWPVSTSVRPMTCGSPPSCRCPERMRHDHGVRASAARCLTVNTRPCATGMPSIVK